MRILPTSKDGWIIFYIAGIALFVIAVWAFTGNEPPERLLAFAGAVEMAFFAVLRNVPQPKPGSTTQVDLISTITTPPEAS